MVSKSKIKGKDVLKIKMDPDSNDAGAKTIKEYLKKLLENLWAEGEGFSGKRPFGNSDWEYDLYIPLIEEGVVEGRLIDDGYLENVDRETANALIFKAIEAL